MKKRLLITSIVMMLVVAVALGTSTYAWFTSNTQVTAEQVLLTASTMGGDAIMISRTADNNGLSNTISFAVAGADKLYPATPTAADSFTNLGADKFISLQIDGTNTAKSQALSGSDKAYYSDTFYVYNKGFNNVVLAPVVSIYFNNANGASSDAAHSVRIAIIEEQGSWSSGLTFASPVLKNIYEFDDTEGKTVVLDTALTSDNYVVATEYAANTDFYRVNNGVYEKVTIANADAFASAKTEYTTLFKIDGTVSTTHKNTAKAGALTNYGASTTDTPATADSAYTNAAISYTAAGYTAVTAPASGTYIANKYTIVIWLEGWDAQCTNAMSAGLFRVDVNFSKASA